MDNYNSNSLDKNDIKVIINCDSTSINDIFNVDNDYVMYILINNDLGMKVGKILSQTSHVLSKIIRTIENMQEKPQCYDKWIVNSEPKIILKAKDEELLYCINNYSDYNKDIWCNYQLELSKTKNDPFSITAVIFVPIKKKETPVFIKKLKLL